MSEYAGFPITITSSWLRYTHLMSLYTDMDMIPAVCSVNVIISINFHVDVYALVIDVLKSMPTFIVHIFI